MRFRDRVKDTTTTTGTGTITLSGTAPTGFRTFATAYPDANARDDIPYAIVGTSGEWEVGVGTLVTSTTFSRTRIYTSSNAGAAVNFSAGTKDVFVTIPEFWMRATLTRGRIEMGRRGQAMP